MINTQSEMKPAKTVTLKILYCILKQQQAKMGKMKRRLPFWSFVICQFAVRKLCFNFVKNILLKHKQIIAWFNEILKHV